MADMGNKEVINIEKEEKVVSVESIKSVDNKVLDDGCVLSDNGVVKSEIVEENVESDILRDIKSNDIIGTPILKEEKKSNKKNIWITVLICVLIGVVLGSTIGLLSSIKDSGNTNIKISDKQRDRLDMITIDGSEEIYTASQIYAANIDSVVAIQTEIITTNIFKQIVQGAASGSGFIISEDGYVLTNYHVVEGANKINVALSNGKEYKAKLVGAEEQNDIAVLKIESEDKFQAVILGNSEDMIIGEDVIAIGNPLGELTFSLTKGIVSALDREIQIDNLTTINMFQVDCAVNEGNSGGPIFNMYGEVVGVVSAKYASETIEGLGFCIPINDVSNIITDLIEHGKIINKAYMGVEVANVEQEMIDYYKMVKGAYIAVVEKDSSAEKAGLKVGDIIVEFNNKKIESVSELLNAKKDFRAGDSCKLKVWRSGEYLDLTITFSEEVVKEEQPKTEEERIQEMIDEYNRQNSENRQQQQTPNGNFSMDDFFRYFYGY